MKDETDDEAFDELQRETDAFLNDDLEPDSPGESEKVVEEALNKQQTGKVVEHVNDEQEDAETRIGDLMQEFDITVRHLEKKLHDIDGYDAALQQVQEDMKRREKNIELKVATAKDEEGDKKYPNKTAREAAVYSELEQDDEYQALEEKREKLKDSLNDAKTAVNVLKYRFRALQAKTDLEAVLTRREGMR